MALCDCDRDAAPQAATTKDESKRSCVERADIRRAPRAAPPMFHGTSRFMVASIGALADIQPARCRSIRVGSRDTGSYNDLDIFETSFVTGGSNMSKVAAIMAASMALLASTSTARAQDALVDPDLLAVRIGLGLGGEVELDDSSDDLEPSFGFDLTYARALHEHFAMGAGVGLLSWVAEVEGDPERNLLLDFSLRPEARLHAHRRTLLYLAGILGLSYSNLGEDEFLGGDVDPAVGYHVGLALGIHAALTQDLHLNFETALLRHHADHEVDTLLGSFDIDGEVSQLLVRAGVSFGF